jgi:DNA-binding PadR family transcriptional regulator
MDETEFKIIDALSRDPDEKFSISALTRDIHRLHGTAHYPNIYKSLQRMHEEGIIDIERTGNSSLVSLNIGNMQTIDALTEMEIRRKHILLAKWKDLRRLLESISAELPTCQASLIDAERNVKLNRAELLIQLPDCPSDAHLCENLSKKLREIEGRLNIRIDPLMLDEMEFRALLAARDRNQLKEMLSRHTALQASDLLWNLIRNAWTHGIRIHFDSDETIPAKISGGDLIHNLARFGYTEFGARIGEGRDIGIEYIVIALLLNGNARRTNAIPVILAKNKTNYSLLLFLAKKYGLQSELYGLLNAMAKHREDSDLRRALSILEKSNVREVKVNDASIEKIMRTYNALAH